MKILLFEQDDLLRKVVLRQLKKLNYEIIAAQGLSQAIEVFNSQKVDLIITSNGKQCLGLKLIAEIRKISAEISIIFTTVSNKDMPNGVIFIYKNPRSYLNNLIQEINKIKTLI